MSNVAEGNGFIAGRSRETAVELLELAEENEIDPTEIQSRTFPPGYEVPEKLQKAYADKHGAKPTAAEKKAKQAATAEEKRVKAEADAKEKERLAQEALDEAAEQERLAAEELEQKIADERKADEAAASEAKTDAKPSAK